MSGVLLAHDATKDHRHFAAPAWQVDLGVLTQEEVEECISSEFNPVRAGFHGSPDVWTQDVLNLGVRPDRLVDKVIRL